MVLVRSFPDCGDIQPGEVGAFIIGNEAYIKEYQKDGLHSFNSAYKTMKFTDEDKVFFIGKVVGTLGVIGPTRMAYDRMIQIVDITSRLVSNALSQK